MKRRLIVALVITVISVLGGWIYSSSIGPSMSGGIIVDIGQIRVPNGPRYVPESIGHTVARVQHPSFLTKVNTRMKRKFSDFLETPVSIEARRRPGAKYYLEMNFFNLPMKYAREFILEANAYLSEEHKKIFQFRIDRVRARYDIITAQLEGERKMLNVVDKQVNAPNWTTTELTLLLFALKKFES